MQRVETALLVSAFQSTPVIANGRIAGVTAKVRKQAIRFNPRPLLLTGESY